MALSNKRFTITDIAKSAGVSKTTVSRYINGKFEYMSEETRERIESIIQVANFQPNNMARSLKSQKSNLIGLVIADIESPFSSAIIKGVGGPMRNAGYSVIIVNSDNSYEKEKEYISSLVSQRVDGLIVNTTTKNNPFLIDLANRGLPIVLTDRFISNYNFDIVYIENEIAIANAVHHLVGRGYGHIALFVQPYDKISPRYLRHDAFIKALSTIGITSPEQYVFEVDITDPESVPSTVKNFMAMSRHEDAPPAIITTNGVTLLHTVNAIRMMGLNMPNELGLCGYDDWGWAPRMDWASMVDPGITTLSAQPHDIGKIAAEVLLERINDSDTPKKNIALPAELVIRGSTTLEIRL